RGLKSATDLLAQAVDWAVTTDPDFGVKYHRAPQVLESGPWGRRLRIFFDEFYGEAIEVEPGQTYRRATTDKPFAGIVWSGMGTLNDRPVAPPASQMPQTYGEFLCTPGGQFEARALGESPLLL